MRFRWDVRDRSLFVLLALWLAACGKVSPDDVARWKAAPDAVVGPKEQTGLDRLAGAIKTPELPVDLRVDAAAALMELGRGERIEWAISALPIEAREVVLPPMIARLEGLLAGAPQARRTEMRDTFFGLRAHATSTTTRPKVEAVLFPLLTEDLKSGDPAGGRRSLVPMMLELRAVGVPLALTAIEDPRSPFAPIVEILDKVGNKESKEKGGAALVKRVKPDAPVPSELWPAMATLGGGAVIELMKARIDAAAEPDATRAAEAMAKLKREPSLLPYALAKAADGKTAVAIRDQMLEVARNIGGPDTRKGLIELLGKEPDAARRTKEFAALLKVSRGEDMLAALEAFPKTITWKADDLRRDVLEPLVAAGWDGRQAAFKAMESSKDPLARTIAVWFLEKQGFKSDAEYVQKLEKDRGVVRGLPSSLSVGAEAKRVTEYLKKQSS